VSFDANAHRDASLRAWEEAAPGWVSSARLMRAFGAPVSHWLIDAISPQPGQRLLELAGGLGETGLLAAEIVAPVGTVTISDQAEAMLAGARERAEELGIANVEFKVLNAEWIDLPVATLDAVICRWGYMLMADPPAALGETRRVLRPGGRLALAVWDALEHNPWAHLPALELGERGLGPPPAPAAPPALAPGMPPAPAASPGSPRPSPSTVPAPDAAPPPAAPASPPPAPGVPPAPAAPGPFAPGQFAPGPFALGDRRRVRELLEQAGFAEVRVEALDLHRRHASFDEFWETTLDLSRSFHDAVLARPQAEIEQIRDGLAARFEPYRDAGGALDIPARTLVACASA
jgi:SAM-dependent methyltransferase